VPSIINTFPEIPVAEDWTWLTDVMSTKNGTESRLSLRPTPRSKLVLNYVAVEQDKRREFTEVFARDLRLPSTVPVWPFASRVTTDAAISATKVFFDPVRVQLSALGIVVFVNPYTGEAVEYFVTSVDADGANLAAPLAEAITTQFFAIKGITGLLANGQGFAWSQITGNLSVNVDSWDEPPVVRDNNAETVDTFDSLPIIREPFFAEATEQFEFPREIIDNNTGVRSISARYLRVNISGNRKFKVDRGINPQNKSYDYWSKFLDTVKGSWKPFLLSSRLNDLTLFTVLSQGATTINVNEAYSHDLFLQWEGYRHFEILYSDGTFSEHTVTNSVDNTTHAQITFTPALPSDPKVNNVDRVSYLLKVRMSDNIKWEHFALESELSFNIVTTDNG